MDTREGNRVKILLDAHVGHSSGASEDFWGQTISAVSELNGRDSWGELLLLTDSHDFASRFAPSARIVDFPHRDTPYSALAAEADLLSQMCRTLEISVFVTATRSYQFACPSVVVAWQPEQPLTNGVAWVMSAEFVVTGAVDPRQIQGDFPFIDDADLYVTPNVSPSGEADPVDVARHIIEASKRAMSRAADGSLPLNEEGMRALADDFQSRMRRIQI
jgi:hypothetical protein